MLPPLPLLVLAALLAPALPQPLPRPLPALRPNYQPVLQHLDPEGKHLSDDSTMEANLLNYLFAKQLISRLHDGQDYTDLVQKRTYWKQCAFNAVSCFGRKK